MKNGCSTFWMGPNRAIRFMVIFIPEDKCFHAKKYPFQKLKFEEFCDRSLDNVSSEAITFRFGVQNKRPTKSQI